MQALPRVARGRSSNPEAYVYLAESHRPGLTRPTWPTRYRAGWSAVRWRNLTGGIVALHAAYKANEKPVSEWLSPVDQPRDSPAAEPRRATTSRAS